MKARVLLPLVPLVLYLAAFGGQERAFRNLFRPLQPLPSAAFMRAASGYGKQLLAEMGFIQAAVFLGGAQSLEKEPESYGDTLAHNFLQISTLYPAFVDTYYFAQSNLAYVSPELARTVVDILEIGRKATPDNFFYPFFQGFDYFEYLGEPLRAAEIFHEAAKLPGAPSMYAHLAFILEAEGGELEAGILSLQALLRGDADEGERQRYTEELAMLQQALAVQQAVFAFNERNGRYPETLDELTPGYLTELPEFGTKYKLTYKPPRVGLIRPHRQQAGMQ